MSNNATLIQTISKYNPHKNRQDSFCKIDIIKLARELEDLKNPVFYLNFYNRKINQKSDEKEIDEKMVVEAFLNYATTLVKEHPTSHLNKNIERMFGEVLERMRKIAPEAYAEYEKAQEVKQPDIMTLKKRDYVAIN